MNRARLVRWLLPASLALAAVACASRPAAPEPGRFVARSVEVDGMLRRYQVFVPSGARSNGSVPVILFLHGTGERGDDGEAPTRVGLAPYVRKHAAEFPAIVVFPQAPAGSDWRGSAARTAFAALSAASAEFGGDPRRTYLTGLSMGGYGTWELALAQPERFAALVPVCGGLSPPRAERDLYVAPLHRESDPVAALTRRLQRVPVWIFHGAQDDVVPPHEDRRIHAAFAAAGADARYTEFPGIGHDSWDAAYAHAELWPWLFAQKRQ